MIKHTYHNHIINLTSEELSQILVKNYNLYQSLIKYINSCELIEHFEKKEKLQNYEIELLEEEKINFINAMIQLDDDEYIIERW